MMVMSREKANSIRKEFNRAVINIRHLIQTDNKDISCRSEKKEAMWPQFYDDIKHLIISKS